LPTEDSFLLRSGVIHLLPPFLRNLLEMPTAEEVHVLPDEADAYYAHRANVVMFNVPTVDRGEADGEGDREGDGDRAFPVGEGNNTNDQNAANADPVATNGVGHNLHPNDPRTAFAR
jgi:hypothetical protein